MSQQEAFVGQARPNGQSAMNPVRAPNDVRYRGHNGHGQNGSASQSGVAVPVPRGPGHNSSNSMSGANGQAFAGARSPPNAKNTSHVPCKFYKQGACQAGNACPFLHADNVGPCKYFQKGNCKFGMRCANEHITPDGRRVNKQNHINMAAQIQLGNRIAPPMQQQPGSLLAMQHDQFAQPYYQHDPSMNLQMPSSNMYDVPAIEASDMGMHDESLGSPPGDRYIGRSPSTRGLSVLEAPLPASFDSQGISIYARHGPMAASVPARLGGLEASSPPFSHHRGADSSQSSAIGSMYVSAFAEGSHNVHMLGMSPSGNDGPPQRMGLRSMHSATYNRPKILSASVGNRRYLEEEDEDFEFTTMFEDAVPSTLNDLLTPQERLRRLSRTAEDDSPSNHRAALSGIGTPSGASPKVGSPGTLGASPSRYGPLFQRQQRDREAAINDTNAASFGHVGSPLRSSLLNPGSSPSTRATNGRPTSGEFSVSSPPRAANGSLIAQHLQRSRLSNRTDSAEQSALQHPGIHRIASGGASAPPNRLDRTVSTTSSTGFSHDKIDEEDGGLFAMEGLNISDTKNKRTSAGSGGGGGAGGWAAVAREGAERERRFPAQHVGVIGGRRAPSAQTNGSGT